MKNMINNNKHETTTNKLAHDLRKLGRSPLQVAAFLAGAAAILLFSAIVYVIGEIIPLSNGGSPSTLNIVWDGTKYGLAWVSNEGSGLNLHFATIDVDGNKLTDILVAVPNDNPASRRPALLWTGTGYALSWSGGSPDRSVYFAKIASDGQTFVVNKKKAVTTATAEAANGPIVSLTWNGTNFGVAWQDIRDSGDGNNPALYFGVLDSVGNKLIGDTKISGEGPVGSPAVFSDGSDYSIFWVEGVAPSSHLRSVYFTKVAPTGDKLIANTNLNTTGGLPRRPSVAKNNDGYGIIWTAFPESSLPQGQLYFRSVDFNGNTVLSDELVTTVGGNNDYAHMIWNGSDYALVWGNLLSNAYELFFGLRPAP